MYGPPFGRKSSYLGWDTSFCIRVVTRRPEILDVLVPSSVDSSGGSSVLGEEWGRLPMGVCCRDLHIFLLLVCGCDCVCAWTPFGRKPLLLGWDASFFVGLAPRPKLLVVLVPSSENSSGGSSVLGEDWGRLLMDVCCRDLHILLLLVCGCDCVCAWTPFGRKPLLLG